MTQEFVKLPREVVERMIENMKSIVGDSGYDRMLTRESEQILRAALEQPQAKQPAMTPIAQRKLDSLLASGYTISGYSVYHEQKHQHGFVTGAGLVGWWRPEGMEYPQPRGEQEPDWSDSKTLPSELWKNPLLSLQERLQIADGTVQWNREVAENLRARLRADMDESTQSYNDRGDISIASEIADALSLRLDEYDRAIEAAHNIK